MDRNEAVKTAVLLLVPLLLFFVLLIPYSWFNQSFVVEWFGCGCPKADANGNMVENGFNANDFTAFFWLFVTVVVTAASGVLSKKIPADKKRLRAVYVAFMLLASLVISYFFCQMLQWN